MSRALGALALVTFLVSGCGPSATELREQTLSILNTEADRWDGDPKFATSATDAYGRPLSSRITENPLAHVLEVRSNGPDGLPKNSDDIVVSRTKAHGSLTEEAAKAVEAVSSGATSGAIKGIKKGLGFGGKKE